MTMTTSMELVFGALKQPLSLLFPSPPTWLQMQGKQSVIHSVNHDLVKVVTEDTTPPKHGRTYPAVMVNQIRFSVEVELQSLASDNKKGRHMGKFALLYTAADFKSAAE